MTHQYPAVSSPQAQETRDDIIDRLRHYLEQREVETTKWRDQAEQMSDALRRVRAERDIAVAEQHRLFRGMATAGRELDAARRWSKRWKRIATLEREQRILAEESAAILTRQRTRLESQLGETQAALVRWHRANETPDFQAADDALAELAARCAERSHENA